jgi:membrane protein DedA with SNARE-associated domain
MERAFDWILDQGSYPILFLALFVNGFGVPIPEDLVLIAGGVLAHRGITSFPLTLAVCFTGVLVGDALLFTAAGALGPRALDRKSVAKVLTPERRARLERLISRYGGLVVFVGRHLAGLRPAVFSMTAVCGMKRWRFILWDTLGLCITAPLVLTLGYEFSDQLDRVKRGLFHAKTIGVIAAVVAVLAFALVSWLRARHPPHPKHPDHPDQG